MNPSSTRVVIVAANANTEFGGEAILPWHYFRLLRARGFDAHLVTHPRNRPNLSAQSGSDVARIHFTGDRRLSRFIERLGKNVPHGLKPLTVWLLMSLIGAQDLRKVVRGLVMSAPSSVVVHEPTPVSPRQPSFMVGLGAPLVVGPLNGGMAYPKGFRVEVPKSERLVRWIVRLGAELANVCIPGKRCADAILVANERTRESLPRVVSRQGIRTIVENAVDLTVFAMRDKRPEGVSKFIFVGRLVDWKRVDLLLEAFARVPTPAELHLVGSGPMLSELELTAGRLGIRPEVTFHGQLDQPQCAAIMAECSALVLPSVFECGGAVVLEAMAVGLPVIATNWGGPADYVVNSETGFLVNPTTVDEFVEALAKDMEHLASDTALASRMGEAGRRRVENEFDWERKIDQLIDIYGEVLN